MLRTILGRAVGLCGFIASGPLVLLFAAAAAATRVIGYSVIRQTEVLDSRFHLASACGKLIGLAIATNLPEVAITDEQDAGTVSFRRISPTRSTPL